MGKALFVSRNARRIDGVEVDSSAIADGYALAYDSASDTITYQLISIDPAGSDTHIQFNDGGSFGGEAAFSWDKATDTLTVDSELAISQRLIKLADTATGAGNDLVIHGSNSDDGSNRGGHVTIKTGYSHSGDGGHFEVQTGDGAVQGMFRIDGDGAFTLGPSLNGYMETGTGGTLTWDIGYNSTRAMGFGETYCYVYQKQQTLPADNGLIDIGATAKGFKDLYLTGTTSTINLAQVATGIGFIKFGNTNQGGQIKGSSSGEINIEARDGYVGVNGWGANGETDNKINIIKGALQSAKKIIVGWDTGNSRFEIESADSSPELLRIFNTNGYLDLEADGDINANDGLLVDPNKNCIAGDADLGGTATDGFLYIPETQAAPSGTPTSATGYAPICLLKNNGGNATLYAYDDSDSAWKSVALS